MTFHEADQIARILWTSSTGNSVNVHTALRALQLACPQFAYTITNEGKTLNSRNIADDLSAQAHQEALARVKHDEELELARMESEQRLVLARAKHAEAMARIPNSVKVPAGAVSPVEE